MQLKIKETDRAIGWRFEVSGLSIDYENDGFPPAVLPNVQHRLDVSWDEILWAAVTVGRPDIFHVFRHGSASFHEAVFRWSMVRMALQQRGERGKKLVRTDLFKQMDPTEKGAVSYFIGLIMCKLFSARLLDAHWTLHLDVFRDVLDPRTLGGRSRPDMVAQSAQNGDWYAFECKGRVSIPGTREKQKAKAQAERLVSVGGISCTLHVGAITFFRNEAVEFYWKDPEPSARRTLQIPNTDLAWRSYYAPFIEIIQPSIESKISPSALSYSVDELDLTVSVHADIWPTLVQQNWRRARSLANELRHEFVAAGFQPDGLLVEAGPSWRHRFEGTRG